VILVQSMPASQITYSDKGCGIAFYGNVVVMDICGALSTAHVRAMGDIYRKLVEKYPKLVTLVVARQGVPLAGPEVRTEGARVARETAALVAQVAIVYEDTGLFVQIMRTALRGFSLMARNTPLRVYDDLNSAIDGIRPFVNDECRSDYEEQLRRAIQLLRTTVAQ
jgi:hypothetical protein